MSTQTQLECPRCSLALFSGGTVDIDMFGCGKCCGIWIDNRGCHQLMALALPDHAREQIRNATQRNADHSRAAGNYRKRGATSDAACPLCRKPLTPYTTKQQQHGVVVRLDVCAEHGTWFDQGEAWALLQAAELKGLAVSIAVDADMRRRDELDGGAAWGVFIDSIALLDE